MNGDERNRVVGPGDERVAGGERGGRWTRARKDPISEEPLRITARRAEKHRKWKCLVAAVTLTYGISRRLSRPPPLADAISRGNDREGGTTRA